MLFRIINGFLSIVINSGYNVKGKCACLMCEYDTYTKRLDSDNKNVFLGHYRFLTTTFISLC